MGSSWNTSKVTDMNSMFKEASSFNQNISSWDILKANDISEMFKEASAFSQKLCWDLVGKDYVSIFESSSSCTICCSCPEEIKCPLFDSCVCYIYIYLSCL